MRAWCEVRGLTVHAVIIDPGVSASIGFRDRPGGARASAMIEAGEAGVIVACKLDRLFRDCADCLRVTEEWDRIGVAVHLLDLGGQAIDTRTATGRFFLTVMAAAAEMERNLIRERTKTALAFKKASGACVGGVPLGMRRAAAERGRLEPDPEERRAIDRIHELAAEGLGCRRIADRLNHEGWPSRGSAWQRTTVHAIMQSGPRREA